MRGLLSRLATRRVHVLVAEAPAAHEVRRALEQEVCRRGWVLAGAAADADLLAVVGSPGRRLGEVVERVWDQLPDPRVRLQVGHVDQVAGALDAARAELADTSRQRDAARDRPSGPQPGETDHGEMDHGEMDHGDMAPSGIPLAEGAQDRDGLEMDVLHLPLGPVLRHWPAGLVLHLTLHGDLVGQARVERLDEGPRPPSETGPDRMLDAAASVLDLAGRRQLADRARELRDPARIAAFRRRVLADRVLLWGLGGAGSEVVLRLDALLGAAAGELDQTDPRSGAVTDARLAGLVRGRDLGEVRLLVATLVPWLEGDREAADA
ncbi:hypothetical protein IE331_12290 [Nocardioides sp. MJB4]|uniref:Uncharacterized protein n=1 Tax=Nocardioides donggukensis TaxID=2774019 RepID=A0A927Q1R1_9ACTN|nr:hypothetical protein [Nocardioides donggukensis]